MPLFLDRRPPADWPSLAPLIHAWNQRPDGGIHCLHAGTGGDAAAHADELASLPPEEAAFWTVMQDGEPVGVVGCEFDPSLRRAWMRGPLVASSEVLDALPPRMVDAALAAALPAIETFDGFPAPESAPLNDWYRAAGYTPLLVHTALRAELATLRALPAEGVEPARAPDLPTTLRVHEDLFPSPYLAEEGFRKALDATDCALLVARSAAGEPLGYLYVEDRPADQEVYVHYLGVVESARGRGLGKALLGGAARWGAERGRSGMTLTVREDRPAAIELYRRSGFVETSRGRQWRRTVPVAQTPST